VSIGSRASRWFVILVAVAAGLVGLYALLGYLVAPGLARTKLEEVLTRELGRPTSVERVEVRPFALAATVHGIVVREPQGDAVALSIESIDADASIASLAKFAPVLDALSIGRPHLRVARLDANHYSVSDLIEKWSAPRTEPPAKYSLNNIEVREGRVDFDDRPVKRAHVVDGLEVGVPFLSTLPHDVEIVVQPRLAGAVNGAPFALAGRATPFATERRAELDVDVDALPLPQYVDYLPARLRVGVKDGRLTTRLKLHLAQHAGAGPSWWVDGSMNLDALELRRRDGAPLVAVTRASTRLERLDVGARELKLASVEIEEPSAAVRRLPDGAFELAGGLFERAPAAQVVPEAAPWKVAIASVSVANGRATLEDASVAPAYRASVANFKGRASSLSNAPGAKGPVEFSLDVDDGARGELRGEVALAPFAVAGTFSTGNASIARLYPYVAEVLDVEIQRGRADFSASFEIAEGRVRIEGGKGALADVALAQRGEREPLWRSARIAFAGVALDAAKRALSIDEVTAEKLFADLRHDRDGSWNYARLLRIDDGDDDDREGGGSGAKAASGGAWQIRVDRIAAARAEVRFRDLHAPSPIELSFDQVDVSVTGASNAPGARAAIDVASRVNRTGRLRAKGRLGTNPVAATLTLDASRIALMPFRTYIERALAVTLTGGSASARGTLDAAFSRDADARIRWAGDLALENFGANDPPTGSRLLAWKVLRFEGTKANLDPFEASAGSIALEDFYARVIVYADGTLNLARIAQGEEATPGPASAQATAQPRTRRSRALAGTTTAVGSAAAAAGRTLRRASDGSLPLSIGRIAFSGGNVNFSDFFVRPNYSVNLTGLAGTVSAMSPAQAGTIDATAKVDDAAPVEIHGELAPFARELTFRLAGKARDIELPPLSPYSAKYAGYGITRGKMSFEVDYRVDNRKLDAKNRLVLAQLTFGEKVDSPEATKLPVLFAVSLLKDANGVIDLDIPISGSLDDPKFSMFAIVVKIVVNLLTRAATAPFALLSSIAGGVVGTGEAGGEDLAYLEFEPGSASVDGAAAARVERLAKALVNRPALKVDVTGRADAASDGEGLARAALDRQLRETKLAAVAGTPDEVASADAIELNAEERARWVAWLYRNTPIEGRPRDAAGAPTEVAPAEMEVALARHFAPAPTAVAELAQRRARAAKEALVARGLPAERVFLVAPSAPAPAAKDSSRRVDFALR
jgi:uncharacterized protein involved in outer membrane biogenesis